MIHNVKCHMSTVWLLAEIVKVTFKRPLKNSIISTGQCSCRCREAEKKLAAIMRDLSQRFGRGELAFKLLNSAGDALSDS